MADHIIRNLDEEDRQALARMYAGKAEQARRALDAYPGNDSEDLSTSVVDLLCDLMHLVAEQTGDDFEALLGSAESHYEAERAPDDLALDAAHSRWSA